MAYSRHLIYYTYKNISIKNKEMKSIHCPLFHLFIYLLFIKFHKMFDKDKRMVQVVLYIASAPRNGHMDTQALTANVP